MGLLKTSKVQMALVLIVFALWAIFVDRTEGSFLSISASILVCVLTDVLLAKIRRTPFFFPSAAIVSGLIIGLISPPHMYSYIFVAGTATMIIKNILRVSNRHIFNPAASGLLISSLIFTQSVAWSGAPIFLFILPAYVSLIRVRKYYLILSFLFLYSLLLTLLNTQNILNTLFDPTILFFSLIMLPEPMTSPSSPRKQLLFGTFVAVLVMGISLLAIPIDPLLTSLLLANAVFFKFR